MSMRYFQSLDLLPSHFERLEAPSIWLRDFMPLQRSDGDLIGFHYGCRYMHEFGEEIFDNAEIWSQLGLKVGRVPIIADGGHFIETPRHWLASTSIGYENPTWSQSELTATLECALGKPVLWLKPMPGDFTGHLDGIVRWHQGNELLVYAPLNGLTVWQKGLALRLITAGYSLREVTTILSEDPISAEGLVLNYVFDGQVHYGISPTPVLPDVPYQFIAAQNVLREGGGLHCITANFKIP